MTVDVDCKAMSDLLTVMNGTTASSLPSSNFPMKHLLWPTHKHTGKETEILFSTKLTHD